MEENANPLDHLHEQGTSSSSQRDPVIVAIAEKLRAARDRDKAPMSKILQGLEKLGWKTSLSQLSRIERGEVDLGYGQLKKVAEVYGIPLVDLLEWNTEPLMIIRNTRGNAKLQEIVKSSEWPKREHDLHRGPVRAGKYRYVELEYDLADQEEFPGKVERTGSFDLALFRPMLVSVGHTTQAVVKSWLDEPTATHPAQEFMYILSGEIEFWYKPRQDGPPLDFTLHQGDCVYFSSVGGHALRSTGDGQAHLLVISANVPQQFGTPKATAGTVSVETER